MNNDVPWGKHLSDLLGCPVLAEVWRLRVGYVHDVIVSLVDVPLLDGNSHRQDTVTLDFTDSLPAKRSGMALLVDDVVVDGRSEDGYCKSSTADDGREPHGEWR